MSLQPAHFSFLHGLDETRLDFNQSIFSVQVFSIHGTTTLHHDCRADHHCPIIADLFETQDNLHVLFPRLINNIMIAILACTSIQGSRISNATIWSTRWQCLLRNSGGGCAAVVAAAQLLQPGGPKKYHDARAGLLVVHWGQQGWARWGGRAY